MLQSPWTGASPTRRILTARASSRNCFAPTLPSLSYRLLEVRNVLLTNERRNRISQAGTDKFLDLLGRLNIQVREELPGLHTGKVLTLARHHRLTIYDATYLELAIRQDLPLATRDKELLLAAPLAGVSIFSPL